MAIEEIDGLSVDLDRLPDGLSRLAPEIRRWAVRDEGERARRVDAASTEELAALWLTLSQELPAINAYLDARLGNNGPSNEALVLGAAVEGGFAAAAEVERRTGEPPQSATEGR
jgi:hypothetical protein